MENKVDTKQGDRFLCIKDLKPKNCDYTFLKGNIYLIYLTEEDGKITFNSENNICEIPIYLFNRHFLNVKYLNQSVIKVQQFKQIANEMAELYEKKNHDYGNSFGISIEKYGKIAALTRISDKFNRLESLMLGKEQKVQDEKLEDTLKDMASYCIMTLIEMRNAK